MCRPCAGCVAVCGGGRGRERGGGWGVFVLDSSFGGEKALLMIIVLLYRNAKQYFLKLKLEMYIKIA